MPQQSIIVGLSGGVDSAVAAHLLVKQGYQVEALFMKNWEEDDADDYCAASVDLEDAQKVCSLLGIPLHTVNFSSEYWDQVFSYFLEEHRLGRTPNPDVLCNTKIKFHHFCEHAVALGAEHIATGHYARNLLVEDQQALCTGIDANKDQTYFLHGLNQSQLARSLFPLGNLPKQQVRRIARDLNLPVHDKKDSTGICFIGERRFQQFLQNYIKPCRGDTVDTEGNIIGEHKGVSFYTIGQRQGLGIGGTRQGNELPWYVIDKDIHSNTLTVAQGTDHPSLYHNTVLTGPVHWIRTKPETSRLRAKIRYRQSAQICTLSALQNDRLQVRFDEPQRAVTPGQFIVFYDEEECLGGAVIDERTHEQ